MYDKKKLDELTDSVKKWEETSLQKALTSLPERADEFITTSSEPINRLYTPLDVADLDYASDLGLPGEYPYTRGVHPTLHRSQAVDDAHVRRLRHRRGDERPLQVPAGPGPDRPVDRLRPGDPDGLRHRSARSAGRVRQVRRGGLLAEGYGNPAGRHPARQGLHQHDDQLAGRHHLGHVHRRRREAGRAPRPTARHDPERHPQGIHRPEGIHLPARAVDAAGGGYDRVRRADRCRSGTPSRISGYHIREAGSTAAQELAFTLADGLEYVRWGIARGLDVDEFAPRLSFFFNAHNDFFEEIAKYRAARRIWAREMRETFGAKNPRSWLLRFHTQTAGVSA